MWGAVYPLTTVVLHQLPPSAVIVGRTALAAMLLTPIALTGGHLSAVRARPLAVLGAALLQATLPLVLLTGGQEHVGAGIAGILLASQPIWAALITAVLVHRTDVRELTGFVLGLLGVTLLFLGDLGLGTTSVSAGAALLGAALLFAVGAIYIERVIPEVPPLITASAAMAISAIALVPFAVAAAPPNPSAMNWLRLAVLGAGATGAALVLFYTLIREVGAVRANLAGYLAPGFAVVYGAVFLSEKVPARALVGLALIIIGSYIATGTQATEGPQGALRQGPRSRGTTPRNQP